MISQVFVHILIIENLCSVMLLTKINLRLLSHSLLFIFSGVQIRRILEKIANFEHIVPGTKEVHFVKSDESTMESEVELPKKDPKVLLSISSVLVIVVCCRLAHNQ